VSGLITAPLWLVITDCSAELSRTTNYPRHDDGGSRREIETARGAAATSQSGSAETQPQTAPGTTLCVDTDFNCTIECEMDFVFLRDATAQETGDFERYPRHLDA
jgi:hypothetical protein